MKVVSGSGVRKSLPMGACIQVIESAMRTFSQGRAICPLRTKIDLPDSPNMLGVMYGSLEEPKVFGAKVVSIFPENFSAGLHSHQGSVLLFEPETGAPTAVVDAAEVTAIRTAAASAVATRYLARPESATLAILGYGTQAAMHLEAMCCVAPIESVRVWGRDHTRAQAFANDHGPAFGVDIQVVDDPHQAITGADIICTVTAAATPILLGDWLEPGQHINAVGTSLPNARELDGSAVARCTLFVDSREGATGQAGEYRQALAEGAIGNDHIVAEIGEVIAAVHPGRRGAQEITLYKSLGLIVQDLAAARYVAEHTDPLG